MNTYWLIRLGCRHSRIIFFYFNHKATEAKIEGFGKFVGRSLRIISQEVDLHGTMGQGRLFIVGDFEINGDFKVFE